MLYKRVYLPITDPLGHTTNKLKGTSANSYYIKTTSVKFRKDKSGDFPYKTGTTLVFFRHLVGNPNKRRIVKYGSTVI